ncbi:ABC transporter ATP-binding protein [Actinomadura rugatobispora]|uniref:ABC transporter ATP-binding protein n=1 Tax=Actinomadura rugatobispora TaxID=1994 RepID=A0ABW1A1G1_9ACTN|nr:ATP-binding cassette domain-containing protein [Actinomadura rugatobispora]
MTHLAGRQPVETPLVELRQVARTFGRGRAAMVALHEVGCTVLQGDRIAITGPSGSGKTTLLHLIAGLDKPTAGEVRWPEFGGNPLDHPGEVGLVFQGASLLPALDVLENVALPLLLADRPYGEAVTRARAALEQAEIAELAQRLPEELSGGQAQRVAVARALAPAPRLIAADEPTGRLDTRHALAVVDLLVRAAGELGATLLLATHDPRMAERLDRCWEMRDGTLNEVTA